MQEKINILWADDEIDLLKPHIIFLKDKGYDLHTINNGSDALDLFKTKNFDLLFLDENMPGISGMEVLAEIKTLKPDFPVVLITKSEEEYVMDDAIGIKANDYLIKPVNPNQILLTIKKLLQGRSIVNQKITSAYQQDFANLSMIINGNLDHNQWAEVYKKLVSWELKLQDLEDSGMHQVLTEQKAEANLQFSKFVEKNYINWLHNPESAPLQSHNLIKRKVFPLIDDDPTWFVLIDNLRYDQWKSIEPIVSQYFRIQSEEMYFSILPTATQYARNAIFAGLTPLDIEKRFPKLWQNDEDEGGKNLSEEEFLVDQIKRLRKDYKYSYTKVVNYDQGKAMIDNIHKGRQNQFNVIVYNFVDMLSHARTEMDIIKELASDEKAYRSLTISWFENSPLLEALKKISAMKARLIITTDHGTIRVKNPSKVIGDRNTNTNLRYKQGRNLAFNNKEVYLIKNPHDAFLPQIHLSQCFIFARGGEYFIYPNNYNQFVNYYNNTFQHGGISLEEMIIPFVVLGAR